MISSCIYYIANSILQNKMSFTSTAKFRFDYSKFYDFQDGYVGVQYKNPYDRGYVEAFRRQSGRNATILFLDT